MPHLHLISQISLSPEGPQSPGPDGQLQLVFLRQGHLDGACGPYSVLIALLICGLVRRDDLIGIWRLDKRTSQGQLIARLEARPGLIRDGIGLHDLEADLRGLFRSRLRTERCEESGTTLRAFVLEQIRGDRPVILGHHGVGFSHWSTVIGYEADELDEPTRLLLLDPGGPEPTIAVWNAVLDIQGTGGVYPYLSWGYGEPAKAGIAHALALWTTDS